ncbi:MAG: glycosyltransferase [Ferruginibacter sp.]|nr:glycosyltransferase [Ferruginibacter sp.]
MNKYSIILPVRNGGEYVKICVNSILSQTLDDFNLILLDNCSTDGTVEWIRSLNDNRIIIHSSTRSLSIEESWGRIKDIEKNEFITLIGHDDILYPDFLQTIDDLIVTYPGAGLYQTHFNFIDAHGKKIRASQAMKATYTGTDFLKAFLTSTIDLMGTGYVMRSKDYDELGGIPVKYPNLLFADFELWTMLAGKSFFAVDAKNCFAFRIHQSTTNKSPDQQLHTAFRLFVDFLVGLKEKDEKLQGVIHESGGQFLLHYCNAYAHRMLRSSIKNRNGITIERFIEQTRIMADKLGITSSYHPEKKSSLQLARRIDDSSALRYLFLLFKKIYSKPIF